MYIYTCIYICIYLCVYTWIYIYICICTYTYTYIYIYMHMYVYVYVYIYIYIYTCIYIPDLTAMWLRDSSYWMTLHSNKDLMTTYAATEKVKDICKAVSRQSLKITKWGVSNLSQAMGRKSTSSSWGWLHTVNSNMVCPPRSMSCYANPKYESMICMDAIPALLAPRLWITFQT